ncbi:unnamed protein product, partial [Nesidiocoris tenuis]
SAVVISQRARLCRLWLDTIWSIARRPCFTVKVLPACQVFLGQKYGYRPIPTYILSSELQMIRDDLAANGSEVHYLDTWYRKDSNAVPPISVLQPISSILVNFNNKVFYGREEELEKIEAYMKGDSEKPMVLYGEGGCGKTSLLAKSAGLTSTEWFVGAKPICIIRFLGTTPDSSALTPTLISICQQLIVSCASEADNPEVSKDYHILRKMIDCGEHFIEVRALGEELAMQVIRQFRDTAKERYFKNMNMAIYFHSSIADYFLGIWGGGVPKPFKYTEIQRHRELMLVADALRLGGAILSVYPDMLAPQLVGRLLPEIGTNPNIKMLLNACDQEGPEHCALMPLYHCLHTPGGPLKYSLEGHQFAVFDFKLTSDLRYIVSISNRFITWDLSTSDMNRDVNPGLEGIMLKLYLSPDNKFAAAFTNNSQTVLLNTLSSEFIIIDNPLPEEEQVVGLCLLNQFLFIHGTGNWCRFDMRGQLLERYTSPEDQLVWPLLSIEYKTLEDYKFMFWSGKLEEPNLLFRVSRENVIIDPIYFHSAMALSKDGTTIYCCHDEGSYQVSKFVCPLGSDKWEEAEQLDSPYDNSTETVLQLKLGRDEETLLGTTYNGFAVWDLTGETTPKLLVLPHGMRNISTRVMVSNSFMISGNKDYAVAGVRKNLYVWNIATTELVKVLDAHFGRIISLEPLTIGNWNSVITSSIDRSVKVWNINNIFEQVHVIDRHELQIDAISVCQEVGLAVTVTRGAVGVWDMQAGHLMSQLADSPLGAIVTHALITPSGKFIISAESGNILVWNRVTEQVLFKEEQQGIRQILLLEEGTKILVMSKPLIVAGVEPPPRTVATGILRTIPSGTTVYSFDYPVRNVPGVNFKDVVITCDSQMIVALAADKGTREAIYVFNCKNGSNISKIPLRIPGVKDVASMVAMPQKASQVALVGGEKVTLFDIKNRKVVRTIPKWGGSCTRDGKFGLFAPSRYWEFENYSTPIHRYPYSTKHIYCFRGGLELLELKRGASVRTFIPRVAEGVFTVICMFNKTDEYVLYYHSGKKTIRVFSGRKKWRRSRRPKDSELLDRSLKFAFNCTIASLAEKIRRNSKCPMRLRARKARYQ